MVNMPYRPNVNMRLVSGKNLGIETLGKERAAKNTYRRQGSILDSQR